MPIRIFQGRYARPELLVDTAWLQDHLADRGVRIVDLRPAADYAKGHVPGAVNLDEAGLRNVSDNETYLPAPDAFEAMVRKIGVDRRTRVVAYDSQGGRSATRLWYCLNVFGHDRFSLLDGGWGKWDRERRPVTTDAPTITPSNFRGSSRPGAFSCPTSAVLSRKPGTVVLDVRSKDEYTGVKSMVPGKSGGRIPGAVHVEWLENLEPETQLFRSADDLRALYNSRGVTPDKEVVTYCQSGGRASLSLFALHLLGFRRIKMYYGSFADYSARNSPLEK